VSEMARRKKFSETQKKKLIKVKRVKKEVFKDTRLDKLVPVIVKGLVLVMRLKGLLNPARELEEKVRGIMK
jgi:hypothetical protein